MGVHLVLACTACSLPSRALCLSSRATSLREAARMVLMAGNLHIGVPQVTGRGGGVVDEHLVNAKKRIGVE